MSTDGIEPDFVLCQLCTVPLHPAVDVCDACGQSTRHPVDVEALKLESARLTRNLALAGGAVVVMVVANLIFFSAGAVLLLAPVGWLLTIVPRRRVVRAYLDTRAGGGKPPSI